MHAIQTMWHSLPLSLCYVDFVGTGIDRNSIIPWETPTDWAVPCVASVQVPCGYVDGLRGTWLVRWITPLAVPFPFRLRC